MSVGDYESHDERKNVLIAFDSRTKNRNAVSLCLRLRVFRKTWHFLLEQLVHLQNLLQVSAYHKYK